MPRIRTVKPEFWDSPSTAKAGPWARLAYIAMWNWADDFGRGTANLKELEGFIFPNDTFPMTCSGNTVHFRDIVAEVSACFGVVFYSVGNRPYYAIPGWDRHQRNERRSKESKFPPPPENMPPTSTNTDSSGNTVHFRDIVAETPNISGPGTGEQGNRGTGEVVKNTSASEEAGERANSTQRAKNTYTVEFETWWTNYPFRKGSKFEASKAFAAAKRITDVDTLTAAAIAYGRQQTERQFVLDAERWLKRRKWEDEPPTSHNSPKRQLEPAVFVPLLDQPVPER